MDLTICCTQAKSPLDEGGKPALMEMGCYGIGVTRIVAAAIEQNHDQYGISWPDAIAPFNAAILNLKVGDSATDGVCAALEQALEALDGSSHRDW